MIVNSEYSDNFQVYYAVQQIPPHVALNLILVKQID